MKSTLKTTGIILLAAISLGATSYAASHADDAMNKADEMKMEEMQKTDDQMKDASMEKMDEMKQEEMEKMDGMKEDSMEEMNGEMKKKKMQGSMDS